MPNLYDIAYWTGLGLSSPVWAARRASREKVMAALRERRGQGVPSRLGDGPSVLIHAVSLGEMNATRGLVARLREAVANLHVSISSTTTTGHARAVELYGGAADTTVIKYPLDFTPAVGRVLDALRPDVVVLMELEMWPNFLLQCERRGIGVIVVNGRMSDHSYRRYRMARPLVRSMFGRLACACVQEPLYAERFGALGVAPSRIRVTGTMKFDTADVGPTVGGADELAWDLRLGDARPLWVAGSTGPGEEQIVLGVYRELLAVEPTLRLTIVPRHPQRFDEVAGLVAQAGFACVRRSAGVKADAGAVILGDTMGELRKFYALARVVFVGRSLVDLGSKQHGSDMIEPAALGRPVVVGRYTGNFADVMDRFRAAGAMREVDDARGLRETTAELLGSESRARELGERARRVVVEGRGATARNVEVVLERLGARRG